MKKLSVWFLAIAAFGLVSCSDDDNGQNPGPNLQPEASFTVGNNNCVESCAVSFTNTSANATSYIWNFGDGTAPATDKNPVHQYTAAGSYTVMLVASNQAGSDTATKTVTIAPPASPDFYITYKADGVDFSLDEVEGLRNTTAPERTLTVRGNEANGVNPTFEFLTTESFIGFEAGLNIGCSDFSYPLNFVKYTNSTGTQYSTEFDDEGMHVFFQEVSYTNGGTIKGTFVGSVKTPSGQTIEITEGKFRVKFSN